MTLGHHLQSQDFNVHSKDTGKMIGSRNTNTDEEIRKDTPEIEQQTSYHPEQIHKLKDILEQSQWVNPKNIDNK